MNDAPFVPLSIITNPADKAVAASLNQPNAPIFTPSNKRVVKTTEQGTVEFEIFNVVDEYNPILKEKAIDWDFKNPPGHLGYIAFSMIQTMIRQGGLGLAANQCGLRYNLFVMGTGSQFMEVVVNPRILRKVGEEKDQEGCLSFPGLFLKIKRATQIEVEYEDINGVTKKVTYDGLSARVFQHEFDHLQGVKFTELVSKVEVGMAKEKVKSNLKKIKRAKEEAIKQQQAKLKEEQLMLAERNKVAEKLAAEAKARQVSADTVLTFNTDSGTVSQS